MPCNHAIETDSMVALLSNLARDNQYRVFCPGVNQNSYQPCRTEWPYELCRKVAIFSKKERQEIEEVIQQNFLESALHCITCPLCHFSLTLDN